MVKRLFSIVLTLALMTACGNSGKETVSQKPGQSESGVKVEFASLVANPENYIGKTIAVEGKVVHVCTETGKKLFIVGDDPDIRLYVAAGENISKFPMELLGNTITVEGVISKAGSPVTTENTTEKKKMCDMACAGGEEKKMNCETETALASQLSLADIRMDYKSHTVK
jgi:hypothetical protein